MQNFILGLMSGLFLGSFIVWQSSKASFKNAMDEAGEKYKNSIDEIHEMWRASYAKMAKKYNSKLNTYQHRELLHIGYLCSNGHKEVSERISQSNIEINVEESEGE